MSVTNKLQIALLTLLIAVFVAASPQSVLAYTRLTAGSVWDESRMLQEFGSPSYSCIAGSSCQSDTSASVTNANNASINQYLQYKCVDGIICQDTIHTELKYIKNILGPGSRLGTAMIPSVTSVRVINSQGEDVTYDACVQPGEKIEIILSSEHRTCGTRALMTHYQIDFNEQAVHVAKGGWGLYVNNFTGGFNFTAPLEEGSHVADVAVINPINPWYYYRGFGQGAQYNYDRFEYMRNNPRSAYYTYELGKQTINVCQTDDNALRASCYASPIQVLPNTGTTFTGKAAGGVGPYTYSWEDGTEGDTKSETYTTIGSKQHRLTVRDSVGNSADSTCSVSVVNDMESGLDWTAGTGWTWSYENAFIPLGEINTFGADRLVTNDSCAFEWETTGMESCRILSSDGSFQEVEVTGTKDLPGGGTYTLECFDAYSLETIASQPVRCLANPNIREI